MYSPKIEENSVRKLYLLKMSYIGLGIRKPMTEMVKEALDEYIPKAEQKILSSGGAILNHDELDSRG
jgi:histidinol phosphatase-like enzyme